MSIERILFRLQYDVVLFIFICLLFQIIVINAIRDDGRYSYSLSTFDPNGKLGQVERAIQAAEHGTPIVAVVLNNDTVLLAAPQILSSPFIIDDGTRRFVRVSSEIIIGHSGLSADGRILITSSQRLAIEHEYTFDESISIGIFLEEMSLLFQEYTMKPGTRPFGASLIVAYVPKDKHNIKPALYQIDPSGNVQQLDNYAVIHGGLDQHTNILTNLKQMIIKEEEESSDTDIEHQQDLIVQHLRDSIRQIASKNNDYNNAALSQDINNYKQDLTVVTATLSRGGIFRTRRFDN